jgi:hypothetical protein
MTNTVPSRRYHTAQTHFLRKRVTYSDAGISDGVSVKFENNLPAGAFVEQTFIRIVTGFNAQTANTLTIGTNTTTSSDIASITANSATVAGMYPISGPGVLDSANALDVFVKYQQSGTAATAGVADIKVNYAPNFGVFPDAD